MSNWFEIRTPKSQEWQPQVAATFTHALAEHIASWMVLMVVATHKQVRWIVFSPDENTLSLETFRTLVRSYYPDAEILDPDGFGIDYPYYRRSVVLSRNESHFFETFADVRTLNRHDPLVTMVQTMDQLEPGEVLTFHVHISSVTTFSEEDILELLTISAFDRGDRYVTRAAYRLDLAETAGAMFGNWIRNRKLKKQRVWAFEERDLERYIPKLSQKLLEVGVYLRFDSPKPERLQSLSDTLAAAKTVTAGGVAQLAEGLDKTGHISNDEESDSLWPGTLFFNWLTTEDERAQKRISQRELVSIMTADELATLWHLPHQDFTASGIQWVSNIVKPLPEALKTVEAGPLLGANNGYNVRLPEDERTQHMLVSGKTGTGKSSYMEQIARQDMVENRGLMYLDPNRASTRRVLRYGVPMGREDDVVVLDFGNFEYPPPLNLLYRPSGVAADVRVGMLMSVMNKVYKDMAFREMSDTLHMALLTLTAADRPTLLDIPRLFDRPEFRNPLIAKLDDFIVTSFWDRYERMSDSKQTLLTQPVLRRLNPFYSNKHLRAITCHPKPINLFPLIAENKIILISLEVDESQIPSEHVQLLGAVLVSQLQMAAMSGAITNGPFIAYIDEAQNFVTTALPKMLDEARKYKLGLVLANQYLGQLTGDTLEAVEGNVSTLVAFEAGDSDARAFAPYMKPQFQVDDLLKLGKYRAAVSMRHQGVRHPAFTLETLAPIEPEDERLKELGIEREQMLRRKSIENYTPMTYSEVDAWLRQRYDSKPVADPVSEGGDDDDFIEASP